MEIFIYILIFIMGTFFGSFFTLAVYRIPLGQDILYTHSYCPNCKHKLNTLDLFPVFSYIFLGGKCRYCGNKIRIRYLLLEILAGIVFLLYALSFKFNFMYIQNARIISFIFGLLYFVCLFITAGIDKEKINIQNSLLIYGFIISLAYIIYVCINIKKFVYTYAIYLLIMLACIIINSFLLHKYKKNIYIIGILALIMIMILFSGFWLEIISLVIALLIIAITYFIKKIVKKEIKKIPIGFYLCITNIVLVILTNFIVYYI